MSFFGGLNFELSVDWIFRGLKRGWWYKSRWSHHRKWPFILMDHIYTKFFQFKSASFRNAFFVFVRVLWCDEIEEIKFLIDHILSSICRNEGSLLWTFMFFNTCSLSVGKILLFSTKFSPEEVLVQFLQMYILFILLDIKKIIFQNQLQINFKWTIWSLFKDCMNLICMFDLSTCLRATQSSLQSTVFNPPDFGLSLDWIFQLLVLQLILIW